MHDPELAAALLQAARAQDFGQTPDRLSGGGPVAQFPTLDLAIVAFARGSGPRAAHVCFSREFPQGWIAEVRPQGQASRTLRYLADTTDSRGVSVAWQPGADWSAIDFQPLTGEGERRLVLPYPASLLKVMVAIGVGLALDAGLCRPEDIDATARTMIVDSDNAATSELVARLHAWGLIVRQGEREVHNALHLAFGARGLHGLRLARTTAAGGWGNAAGSGVGHIHMTAWDTVRLFWLLDPDAPPPPWPGAAPLMSTASRDRVLSWLGEPSPNRILLRDEVSTGVRFWHKTGTTENYASDAGIVRALSPGGRHYIVALISNLGSRYAPAGAEFSVNPRLSGLGLAIDSIMRQALEPS